MKVVRHIVIGERCDYMYVETNGNEMSHFCERYWDTLEKIFMCENSTYVSIFGPERKKYNKKQNNNT